MKIIDDRAPEGVGLPTSKLILAVAESYQTGLDTVFRIVFLGGVGPQVWEIESRIAEGNKLCLSLRDLLAICLSPSDVCEDLCCAKDGMFFGLSDLSCLFIQYDDKKIEQSICASFKRVRECEDSSPQVICRNMLD